MSQVQGDLGARLHHAVSQFQAWSKTVAHTPQWEQDYAKWDEVYSAIHDLIRELPPAQWTPEAQQDVLYALARDNEAELISDELVKYPETLLGLAPAAVVYPDSQARWQVAHALGQINESPAEVERVLNHLCTSDTDEYVRRRSLLSLGYRRSPAAEPLALHAWDTEYEYQRIAAMEVLCDVRSSQLPRILRAADHDPRETVRQRTAYIRQRLEVPDPAAEEQMANPMPWHDRLRARSLCHRDLNLHHQPVIPAEPAGVPEVVDFPERPPRFHYSFAVASSRC